MRRLHCGVQPLADAFHLPTKGMAMKIVKHWRIVTLTVGLAMVVRADDPTYSAKGECHHLQGVGTAPDPSECMEHGCSGDGSCAPAITLVTWIDGGCLQGEMECTYEVVQKRPYIFRDCICDNDPEHPLCHDAGTPPYRAGALQDKLDCFN